MVVSKGNLEFGRRTWCIMWKALHSKQHPLGKQERMFTHTRAATRGGVQVDPNVNDVGMSALLGSRPRCIQEYGVAY